jgi:hypothetical protein
MRQIYFAALLLLPGMALAYPPAPAHRLYGMVRTEQGAPLIAGQGTVILSRNSGGTAQEVARGFTDPLLGAGINYELNVPMDAGLFGSIYQPDAIIAGTAFNIRVVISGVDYVPIQMAAATHTIGQPGDSTRLDLSLGIDTDGDGLSDAWERALIASDTTGRLHTLADVTPDGDIDGDGLTNLQEQVLGASPNNAADGLKLEVVDLVGDRAHIRFVAVRGRTYGIKASPDLITWTRVAFALTPTDATGMSHLANDTVVTQAYVPLNGSKMINFKLCAE